MDHPGYQLASSFEIEIDLRDYDNLESLILSVDSFPLPSLGNTEFQVIWGPGQTPVTFAGPPTVENLELEITNFYSEEVVEFLTDWYRNCLVDCVAYFRNGWVVGKDIDGTTVYKAKLLDVWPGRLSLGNRSRDTQRQRLSVTLNVRDIEEVF